MRRTSEDAGLGTDYGIPPRKRPRLNAGSAHRNRVTLGRLSQIMDMPVDVFCLITSYLEPLDILRISRASKGLRRLLLSREARPIWRSARRNIEGLPDCPDEIPEAHYARVMFEKECTICGAARASRVEYAMMTRFCKKCHSSCLEAGSKLLASVQNPDVVLLHLLPFHVVEPTKDSLLHQLFDKSSFYLLNQALRSKAHEPPSALATFIHDKKQVAKAMMQLGTSLQRWALERRQLRRLETESCVEHRRQCIVDRLRRLGWEPHDFPLWSPKWRKLVNQPRPLTERAWEKSIPDLEKEMKERRDRRERLRVTQRQHELDRHYLSLMWGNDLLDFVPNREDFRALPTVVELMASDLPITHGRWQGAMNSLSQDLRKYRINQLTDFATLMHRAGAIVSNDDYGAEGSSFNNHCHTCTLTELQSVTRQATALFSCIHCGTVLPVTPLLRHLRVCDELVVSKQRRWSIDFVDGHMSCQIAKALLYSIFQDPSHLSLADLAAFGARFMCSCCPPYNDPPRTWQGIVQHFLDNVADPNHMIWQHTSLMPPYPHQDFVWIVPVDWVSAPEPVRHCRHLAPGNEVWLNAPGPRLGDTIGYMEECPLSYERPSNPERTYIDKSEFTNSLTW